MSRPPFTGISFRGVYGKTWKQFFGDLWGEINEDNVFNGAAALGFYFTLAIFPSMIFLLSIIPYLPIPNLQNAIMDLLDQLLPGETSKMFSGAVRDIVRNKREGLLSIGALLTLWAASAGIYAIMQQLNFTYDVKESRPFWKVRGLSILLTIGFGGLVLGALGLVILGGQLESWLTQNLGGGEVLLYFFATLRWMIIGTALAFAFGIMYYLGPDVEQEFQWVTPGSAFAVILLVGASLGFKFYVENFGDYNATYGSIGAIIVLMLWLNIMGLVLLLGSEINALLEHYSPDGKRKGEKEEAPHAGDKRGGVLHRFPAQRQEASGR